MPERWIDCSYLVMKDNPIFFYFSEDEEIQIVHRKRSRKAQMCSDCLHFISIEGVTINNYGKH